MKRKVPFYFCVWLVFMIIIKSSLAQVLVLLACIGLILAFRPDPVLSRLASTLRYDEDTERYFDAESELHMLAAVHGLAYTVSVEHMRVLRLVLESDRVHAYRYGRAPVRISSSSHTDPKWTKLQIETALVPRHSAGAVPVTINAIVDIACIASAQRTKLGRQPCFRVSTPVLGLQSGDPSWLHPQNKVVPRIPAAATEINFNGSNGIHELVDACEHTPCAHHTVEGNCERGAVEVCRSSLEINRDSPNPGGSYRLIPG
jgi:hypothetical protein